MKRHVKASSAGSTSGQGIRLGSRIRGAFATRGFSGESRGSGAPAGRLALIVLAALALCLTVGIGSAAAASFCTGTGVGAGECGEIRGVAVDSSNGNVYAVDQGNNRVDQFAPDGTFVRAFGSGVADGTTAAAQVCTTTCFKGLTAAGIAGGFGTAAKSIAVDPKTHVVYVVTAAARLAYYDGLTGALIGQTEGNGNQAGAPIPANINAGAPEVFAATAGVAVDSSDPLQSYLYVAIKPAAGSKIDKFKIGASGITESSYVCQITGTETDTSVNHTECGGNGVPAHKDGVFTNLDIGNGAGVAQPGGSLAVDPAGNLIVLESITRQVVSKFAKNGDFVSQFTPTQPRPEAVAALESGNVLVAVGSASAGAGGKVIQEYDPASPATPLTEFGSGTISGSFGVAAANGQVYVGDKTAKKIWKFSAAPEAPAVTTEAATALSKFRATLQGKVNPNEINVIDCHFEYGTTIAYGQTAPCDPSPGTGGATVPVSAALNGLTAGTTYHFRLVATNGVGTTNGGDLEFTTTLLNKPEVITTAGATLITKSTAKVAGKVNPNEVNVTDCHFNYGTTTAYGQTAPCVPSPGSGFGLVDVSASLAGLSPNTTYHFQLEATNGDGNSKGADGTFKTLPDPPSLSAVAASEVGQIAAKVSAKVNPNGGNVSDCHIDYGTTTAYGSQKPCVPSPGSGNTPVDISASLIGLSPFTLYHYRVVATNAGGTTNGADQSFTTLPPGPPSVFNDGATAGLAQTFTLEGRVDPNGIAPTDCHFAYGKSGEYEKTAPCVPSAAGLGSGDSPLAVTAATEPLEPNTTYHYRLFATNVRGSAQGKDRIFTTGAAPADVCPNAEIRAAQGIEVTLMPQCMALEQASPSKKANQSAKAPQAISADGNRVLFKSPAALGACPLINGLGGDPFLALRDPSAGWITECTTPPVDDELGTRALPFGYTPNYSHWFQYIFGPDGPQFFSMGLGGQLAPISPPLKNLTGTGDPEFLGSSSDHSHLFLQPETPGIAPRSGSFLPGDPQPDGQGADANLYVTHLDSSGQPTMELLAKDRNGKVWGGNCGARLGGMESTTGQNLNLRNGKRNQGAISADGSHVYFSTRPSQPATGNCTEANKKRIMVREETPAGPEIKELISSECTRVAPACSATDGDDAYQGASLDQKLVYFTTSRQLDDADKDGTAASCDLSTAVSGCDLYLYDADKPAGERLIDVSAGDSTAATPGEGASVRNSITAISADGSHAYFIARTVLTTEPSPTGAVAQNNADNLYLFTYPDEELSFLGTVASADGGRLFGGQANWANDAYPVPITGDEAGGDGHILLFKSKAQLSADDTDSATDIYRYDADAGTLDRVSKAAPGGSDNGAFDAITSIGGLTDPIGGSIGTDYAEKGRWVSEDGETVAFTSKEALTPGDTNGAEDSYLWREGQLYHLPGSTRSSSQISPVVSRDGSALAYHTAKRLTASDGDSIDDVYVLRAGGGFPLKSESLCEGEACQGSPSLLGAEIGAGTGSFSGAGNVKPQGSNARKCPQGKRKVRRNGKARCVKPAKHKKKAAVKKRAGAKQGGQK